MLTRRKRMRTMTALVLACCSVPALAADARPAAQPRRLRVAVMDMRPLGTEGIKAELLSEIALTEASTVQGLDVVGKSDITAVLGLERQKQMLGCGEDTSCLAEIGGALGVDYLLTGSLGRLGTLYRVDLRLVDARKARVLGRAGESVSGEEEKLVGAVQRGVLQLLEPLAPAGAAARASPSPPAGATPASPPAPPPAPTRRFDGDWYVKLVCPPTETLRGQRLVFPATVENGMLDGRSGPDGSPGSVHLRGPVAADGGALLVADAVGEGGARGTRVQFQVRAQLADQAGTGERLDERACALTFTKR
jgi:TolB-like protein